MCNFISMSLTLRVSDLEGGIQYFAYLTHSRVLLILTGPRDYTVRTTTPEERKHFSA